MTVPRSSQISLEHTPYYQCVSRCVRRAFLCGEDRASGKRFDHRKQWIEDRLAFLTDVFAIELLAYAIMDNHYHVVVCIDKKRADRWSDEEVVRRWGRVFRVPKEVDMSRVAVWRERLSSLSWYMRCINEPLARLANREDNCTGHFWEGRFKCQALLDEYALLRCMAYVDLNPIRANIATAPADSDHTSIKARIFGYDSHLRPCSDQARGAEEVLPIRLRDYLALIEWTGGELFVDEGGRSSAQPAAVLRHLGVRDLDWLTEIRHYGRRYFRAVGSAEALRRYCKHLGQQWLRGSPTPFGRTITESRQSPLPG